VNKKADYQDIYHILPLEGKKEVHKSYSSTPSPTQGLGAREYVASIAPQIVLAKFILDRRLWFLELRLVSLLLSKVRKRTCAVKEKGKTFNPDIS
jgi:hypothetical protein